jgi:hypothetical protein
MHIMRSRVRKVPEGSLAKDFSSDLDDHVPHSIRRKDWADTSQASQSGSSEFCGVKLNRHHFRGREGIPEISDEAALSDRAH